ncbi:hypothetical protein, partial [Neorhizobium sp. DT-125]|uniref:hypothetical protein n=1 Tax=Neorhizobium sp. DT-125 TaxID=3396163 RepID=UPI003F19753D
LPLCRIHHDPRQTDRTPLMNSRTDSQAICEAHYNHGYILHYKAEYIENYDDPYSIDYNVQVHRHGIWILISVNL